jgi:hypothetical protein
MKEAKITINGQELTEAQSLAVRAAIILFLSGLESNSAMLGRAGVDYHLRLTQVMAMIDETPAEPSPLDDELVAKSLNFMAHLAGKSK